MLELVKNSNILSISCYGCHIKIIDFLYLTEVMSKASERSWLMRSHWWEVAGYELPED